MKRIPIIAGLGLVTPLGSGVEENWCALLAGGFISNHARCSLDRTSPNRVHHLAIAAADEAIAEAHWNDAPGGAGLVVGTSKGAIDAWTRGTEQTQPPCLASVAVALRAKLPLLDGGPSLTVSAACASGLHALIRAAMMIRGGEAERVLVVAAEASVSPIFLGCFGRLGVLPPEGAGCRPFDRERSGFLMSEAAAAVCLEAADADDAPRRGYATIERYALGGDATHLTSGDPDGTALRRLLKTVVAGRPVDLIHAHGTGTDLNDPVELAAFEDECVIADAPAPVVYSHKGALGHSLGASGLVSIVLSCLMHRRGVVLPNSRTRKPLPARGLRIHADAKTQAIGRSVIVAAGFGGPVGVISLLSA